MDEILKTTLLEYGKSAFLIDLVKYSNGKQCVKITQTIDDEQNPSQKIIKINPSLLADLIIVLKSYQDLFPESNENFKSSKAEISSEQTSRILTQFQKTLIQNRYLKGVPIPDLTVQFDCNEELIIQNLNNRGIPIVNNQTYSHKNFKKFRRKRK